MATSDELRPNWRTKPGSGRFNPTEAGFEEAMAAHEEAIRTGEPGYIDPRSGLFVMTAQFLRDRTWCCDCGCRHCPYVEAATEAD